MSHLTVAASERAFIELFKALRDNFKFSDADSADFGPFSAGYEVAFHLEGGTIDLRDDNTLQIRELDIKWDKLKVTIGINIPEVCVGGFCIIPIPFDGCLVEAPKICVFSDNPDISITLDLSELVTSEISLTASPVIKYKVDPARTAGMSDLEAKDKNISNKWQIFIDPVTVDIDVFDIADIVGDILEQALDNAIDGLLGPLPGWAKDLIKAILGPIIDLVRDILDLPDDIGEWLSDLLGVSLGLFNTIVNFVADYFASKYPLYELEDPYTILEADLNVPLIPVLIPIRDLDVRVNTDEMILEANVGA
ncbi:MAG TPA: hypothetical protein DCY88_29010 [Cyanobacteria bacterium UBA11372]|nr:hypothetical protein [Cyanobacteria bacterium UBA11372]